jgi:hypothetical protein
MVQDVDVGSSVDDLLDPLVDSDLRRSFFGPHPQIRPQTVRRSIELQLDVRCAPETQKHQSRRHCLSPCRLFSARSRSFFFFVLSLLHSLCGNCPARPPLSGLDCCAGLIEMWICAPKSGVVAATCGGRELKLSTIVHSHR